MDFDDPRWPILLGGYRVPYDPRGALRALEQGNRVEDAWQELWNELHHQGDVGEASYAAVPHLVRIHATRGVADWNTYALIAVIEDVRHEADNPPIPTELRAVYDAAWGDLLKLGLRELEAAVDPSLVRSIIAVLAMSKGQRVLGQLAGSFSEDELRDLIDGKF